MHIRNHRDEGRGLKESVRERGVDGHDNHGEIPLFSPTGFSENPKKVVSTGEIGLTGLEELAMVWGRGRWPHRHSSEQLPGDRCHQE